MYGAADLIIVGPFAGTNEQSRVASGSQLFSMVIMVISGLTIGVIVFAREAIGCGKQEKAGRGIGNSKTLLITVAIACVINIWGDLMLVAVFHMGVAIATVTAQAISVICSLVLIHRRELSFDFSLRYIRFEKPISYGS